MGTAHKWLLGIEGLGLLYVSDRVAERLEPRRVARFSVERGSDLALLRWSRGARRYETGTLNTPAIVGLWHSLAMLKRAGTKVVEQRVIALAMRLEFAIGELGFRSVGARPPRSGIVAAAHAELDADEIRKRLLARGVFVSKCDGWLRISPHFYNTDEEVERFLEATAASVQTRAERG